MQFVLKQLFDLRQNITNYVMEFGLTRRIHATCSDLIETFVLLGISTRLYGQWTSFMVNCPSSAKLSSVSSWKMEKTATPTASGTSMTALRDNISLALLGGSTTVPLADVAYL